MGLLHDNIPFGGTAASSAVSVARRDTRLRWSRALTRMDTRVQLGRTMAEDVRRAEGWCVRWKRNGDGWVAPKGRTRYFLFQPSLPLIQATLVRGAFGVPTPARPVHSFLLACLARLLLVPCLPAVRYLRQNLANVFNVLLAPWAYSHTAHSDKSWCRNFLRRHVALECNQTQSQLLCGLASRVPVHYEPDGIR